MNHERHIPRFLKIAIAATGAAVALSGGPLMPSQENNSTPTDTKGTHTEWHIMPCPKDFVPPWEYQAPKNDNGVQQAIIIELASIKKPEPTPNRNQTECWGPVEVPNTNSDNNTDGNVSVESANKPETKSSS